MHEHEPGKREDVPDAVRALLHSRLTLEAQLHHDAARPLVIRILLHRQAAGP